MRIEGILAALGSAKLKCDVCGQLSMYTCRKCAGDFCRKHRVHYKGHGEGYGPKVFKQQ